MALTPTLWRTCRVLAGETRLRLLRQVVKHPGQTVTGLADAVDIKLSRASQELRRLQSRGLIQAERNRNTVKYFPVSDPLVATAKPLLDSMKAAFARPHPASDALAIGIATALSHPRRIAILTELRKGPRHFDELKAAVHVPAVSLHRHLRLLQRLDLARQAQKTWCFIPNRHPLTQGLLRILNSNESKPSR